MLLSVPHRRQHTDGECLLACVEMVLAYRGITVDPQRLSARIGVIPGAGTPLSRLFRLRAVYPGIQVTIADGDVTTLLGALHRGIPPILAVLTGELPYWHEDSRHALVLCGVEGSQAFVNDPGFSQSPLTIEAAELWLAWDAAYSQYVFIE
jgi:ABC-type bacteriocin/lantibiotic exporter with double-glycine peptidase domain